MSVSFFEVLGEGRLLVMTENFLCYYLEALWFKRDASDWSILGMFRGFFMVISNCSNLFED